jgi:DNA-directed RNA polymerase subunit RPC12/RpoP
MTRVYGGCVEPGGFDLDDDLETIECPKCGGAAFERYWEACEAGSINQYHTIRCTECGHEEGDLPDDDHDFARDAELDEIIAKLGY